MSRARMLRQIERVLGDRQLVWFGTRGDDAEGISDIANLDAVFSIIAAYRQRVTISGHALEDYSGIRVDLDAHDIDDDPHVAPINELRRELLRSLDRPTAVVTYRPSMFLSAACFARNETATYLGMFKDHQSAFEHKPWVESAVAGLGIPRVPWTYVADDEKGKAAAMLSRGSVILRRSRSSGGSGLVRVDSPADLEGAWLEEDEAFVSVSPFIDDTIPVNISACVWDDDVTVHFPSVQLIGIQPLTSRPFGYCGNDFAAAKSFPPALLDSIETSTVAIGRWMRQWGYRGAYGVDYLVKDGTALFMEVNPRFQGSTHLSSWISKQLGESCIMTDHLGALLHLRSPEVAALSSRMAHCPEVSHVVQHWLGPARRGVDGPSVAREFASLPGFCRADVIQPPDLVCSHGATVVRSVYSGRVTETGFDVASGIVTASRAASPESQAASRPEPEPEQEGPR